ncbi:hypothetical protein IE81DRAFT_144873 [Ceraceosorus guamensis]|uniref:Velvet domain-containing protein n=1 Tax=Ceraceosorus guamensis TaxID=1522189 RepID=A0A316VWJ6_9BASI|nr:hypothetical protein IE81DRAFT_144873 [Ceraceosorus guamensis]PWN42017.1 hypothetical protein IE81DRAFT_144873 [Ceraceosorus guamensis]
MSNRSRAATLSAASAHPYTFTEFPHQPGASASGQQEAGHEAAQPPQSSYPRAESSTAVATTPLEGISRVKAGLRYQLVVVQHPSRARMCGFGDKDRRPLSPTLIVKLVITEEATGEEVSPWKVNTSLFYLACDLCHPELLMASPRNVLVHHHSTTVPVPSPGLGNPSEYGAFPGPSSRPSSADYPSIRPPTPTTPGAGSLSSLAALHLGSRSRSSSDARGPYDTAMGSGVEISSSGSGMPPSILPAGLQTLTTESYTRNLVGASVASANVLKDERDHTCIFFVLQDLSVRTEGSYRLKLLFADLSSCRDGQSNEGVSTALAEVYTDPFTVYSPRRFPGMHDPTELSKKLAAQGVKIATRSDRKKRRRSGGQGAGASGAAGEEMGEEEEDE